MYVNYAVTIAIGCYLTNYCSSQRAKCAHDLGGQAQYVLRQWGNGTDKGATMGEGGVGRSIESKLDKLSWKARELIDRNSFQMTSSLRTILVGHPVFPPPPLGCSASLVAPEEEKRSNEGCSCNSSMQQSRRKAWKS